MWNGNISRRDSDAVLTYIEHYITMQLIHLPIYKYSSLSFLFYIRHTTSHIGRYGDINLFGIGQIQIGHNVDKLVFGFGLAQARIGIDFGSNRGTRASLVIVRRIDNGRGRQGKELCMDGIIQGFGRPPLKVSSTTAEGSKVQ